MTWQGWLLVIASITVVVLAAKYFLLEEKVTEYFITLIVTMAIIIAIGYWKGEKPRWQWGLPPEEKKR